MRSEDVALITGVLGFVIGLGNLAWIVIHNRRTTFINTVTSERVKWIGKLRGNLSKFVGLTHSWMPMRNDPNAAKSREDLTRQIDILRYEIKLQLNPKADPSKEPDPKIIEKINEIPDLVVRADINPALAAMNELVRLGQDLLKAEWDKVKREAQRGALADTPTLLQRLKLVGPRFGGYVPISATIVGLVLAVVGAGWAANGVIIEKRTATELAFPTPVARR
jgi:hypothetical protein